MGLGLAFLWLFQWTKRAKAGTFCLQLWRAGIWVSESKPYFRKLGLSPRRLHPMTLSAPLPPHGLFFRWSRLLASQDLRHVLSLPEERDFLSSPWPSSLSFLWKAALTVWQESDPVACLVLWLAEALHSLFPSCASWEPLNWRPSVYIACALCPCNDFSFLPDRFNALQPHEERLDITFFVGGPVWAMEWCPTPAGSVASQYLALYCNSSMDDQHSLAGIHSGPALLQLWKLGPIQQKTGWVVGWQCVGRSCLHPLSHLSSSGMASLLLWNGASLTQG